MANAVIGALRVTLGMDSANFEKGAKGAESRTQVLGKRLATAFTAIAAAGAAAMTAIGFAIRGAINDADNLTKLAQSIGVSVSELSALKYAADLSGVSLEGLSTGVRTLNQRMTQIASGSGAAAKKAFEALDISVKNADGTLRSSTDIMADVADRFSRMEDGAAKTGLAMEIFGRQGAALIPLFNQGRDGLQAMKDEAEQLGLVIDQKTGRAAEAFNDNLTRLSAVKDGLITQLTARLLPALEQLSVMFVEAAKNGDALDAMAQGLTAAFKLVIDVAATVTTMIQGVAAEISGLVSMAEHFLRGDFSGGWDAYQAKLEESKQGMRDLAEFQKNLWQEPPAVTDWNDFYSSVGIAAEEAGETTRQAFETAFEPVLRGASGGKAAISDMAKEGQRVFEATRTAAEKYAAEVERLNGLLQAGAIDQDTYNRAVTQAQDAFQQAEQAGNQYTSTLASGFTNMFTSALDGSKSLLQSVGDLLKSLGSMMLNQGFQALLGMGGGGFGGIFSGIGKLFGFARGGTIMPGGAGGIDSQLVAFRKSPNERVDITKPGQTLTAGGGRMGLDVSVSVDEQGNLVPMIRKISGEGDVRVVKSIERGIPGILAEAQMRQG